jgi:hypothetical protein
MQWHPDLKASEYGYYGICLKGEEDKYLRRMVSTTARVVEAVDATGVIQKRWDSVAAAAAALGVSTATISYSVRNRKQRDGLYLQYNSSSNDDADDH